MHKIKGIFFPLFVISCGNNHVLKSRHANEKAPIEMYHICGYQLFHIDNQIVTVQVQVENDERGRNMTKISTLLNNFNRLCLSDKQVANILKIYRFLIKRDIEELPEQQRMEYSLTYDKLINYFSQGILSLLNVTALFPSFEPGNIGEANYWFLTIVIALILDSKQFLDNNMLLELNSFLDENVRRGDIPNIAKNFSHLGLIFHLDSKHNYFKFAMRDALEKFCVNFEENSYARQLFSELIWWINFIADADLLEDNTFVDCEPMNDLWEKVDL